MRGFESIMSRKACLLRRPEIPKATPHDPSLRGFEMYAVSPYGTVRSKNTTCCF
jgi:hypothetical protein